jgi:hypothetical protein
MVEPLAHLGDFRRSTGRHESDRGQPRLLLSNELSRQQTSGPILARLLPWKVVDDGKGPPGKRKGNTTMKRLMILTLGAMVALAATANAQSNPPAANPNAPAQSQVGPKFVDNDGDGICDLFQSGAATRAGKATRRGNGPRDGSGNQGIGPRDGSGYGPGAGVGCGVCDGTGPKGQGRRGPRR